MLYGEMKVDLCHRAKGMTIGQYGVATMMRATVVALLYLPTMILCCVVLDWLVPIRALYNRGSLVGERYSGTYKIGKEVGTYLLLLLVGTLLHTTRR